MMLTPERSGGRGLVDCRKYRELKPEQGSGRERSGNNLPIHAARKKRSDQRNSDRNKNRKRDRRAAKVGFANPARERLWNYFGGDRQ